MAPQEPLARSLSALSRFFVGDGTLQDTLHRVSEYAVQAVPAAAMTGITMLVEGRARTAVFTDEAAPEIDSAQYETGIGPCLDSFRHAKIFRIDDTMKDDRWAPFSEAAAAHGIRSTLSIPLVANHEGLGALNFYSRTPNGFSTEDEEIASQFGVQAAIVLANAQAYWDAYLLSQNLATAMQSRAVIEQAKGILMGAQRCTADEAFQILVRASQRENRKLREIAEDMVTRAQQAGTDGGKG
ncbi:MAG TPA: GAF and ANTAR domain-containing protein [Acidimicrobiales bacterium]|jgi:GAF domain-containing protein|nr:GAF and ANTAR domain-containing protein [Acidimicrobiales bacterium]